MAFEINCEAIEAGEEIPTKYTCDGADISPPLSWIDVPGEAKSLALIFDDPDSPNGIWSHWVLYDLPVDRESLSEGFGSAERKPERDGVQGRNDFGKIGYGGPCPSGATEHRYYFRLYALDEALELPPGANRQQLLDRMQGHVVANTEWMGRYTRRPSGEEA